MSLAMSLVAALVFSSGVKAPVSDRALRFASGAQILEPRSEVRGSSPALKTLYVSYFSLQGADVYSTMISRGTGAREVNPIMDGNLGQMMAVKAVTGLTTYYAVNRMAKTNKKAAIVTLAILNGVTAAVVAHNMKGTGK